MSAIPTPEDARQTLHELTSLMDAFSRWKGITNERIDTLEDENERLHAENKQLTKRLDELEAKAEQAMVVASAGHNPETRSKKEVAYHIARNEIVRRATNRTPSQKRPLTIADVQERGEPEYVLKWQTVRDAFDELKSEWPQFRETAKKGEQALTISTSDVTNSLARAVEADLGRDDLAKGLVGDEPVQGGQP